MDVMLYCVFGSSVSSINRFGVELYFIMLLGENTNGLVGELQAHVIPRPHWPDSGAGNDIGRTTPPQHLVSPEATLQSYSNRLAVWPYDSNPHETSELGPPFGWRTSMHVHGIDDYGMNILDIDYEERSEVTSFLSDVETMASLDCSSDVQSSYAASIESDILQRIADVMEEFQAGDGERDAQERSDMDSFSIIRS